LVKEFGRINPTLPVRLAFGDPISMSGRGNAAHHAAVEFIRSTLQSWGCTTL
jgi:1-acyl-sn-glycerol-3-phosphate acyltransferase